VSAVKNLKNCKKDFLKSNYVDFDICRVSEEKEEEIKGIFK